jgi:hypothetical protein
MARGIYQTTIQSGQALSAPIELQPGERLVGIFMPAAWTTAAITVQAGYKKTDGTFEWHEVRDSGGLVQLTANAGEFTMFSLALEGLHAIRLRSGTSGTPVNQTATRTLQVLTTC